MGIVEIRKEFNTISLGHEIEINTDHKNLVHKILLMLSDCVTRWKLGIEECSRKMYHIPGPNNAVADALSGLPTMCEVPDKNN